MLTTEGASCTHGEFLEHVEELGDELSRRGLPAGQRVVAVLPDGVMAAQALLTLASRGMCCPLDPMLSEPEYARRLEVVRPAAVVVAAGRSPRVRAAARAAGVTVIELEPDGLRPRVAAVDTSSSTGPVGTAPDIGVAERGLLLGTSGTTGAVKFAPIPWPVMVAGAEASMRAYGLTPRDRRLNVMPLFHVQGLVGSVLAALVSGGSVICAASFDPAAVTRSWLREATWFSASPTMHQQICDAAEPDWRPGPGLRFVRCGSAGLSERLRAMLERFYRVPVTESYGMTEAHQIASSPFPPQTAAGLVPTGSQVAIETGPGEITTEPGRTGQVVIRGANVFPGYLPPDPAAFVEGWFRTGDMGVLAADGSLRLSGRARELIIRGGENIAPREVEDALSAHPAVEQVCVAGIPDPVLGERVAAAVTLAADWADRAEGADADGETEGTRGAGGAGPVDAETLRRFAARRLAPFKVPEAVVVFSELPVTGTGKLARSRIAAVLAESVAARSAALGDGRSTDPDMLPDPFPGTAGSASDTLAIVLSLWRQALRTESVDPDTDFYAAGGDSLAVTTMLAAVGDRFGVPITPLEMFDEAATATAMAAFLDARADSADKVPS
ncbi:MAG: non-ribosomal peptide synthetase [Catenulispora sp.]|nr:non-ribosomal peptide synthetase [Catenulispora sp.]